MIKHIWKVHHSQTNNRIERFYETFQSNIMYLESFDVFIARYNIETSYVFELDELETSPIP